MTVKLEKIYGLKMSKGESKLEKEFLEAVNILNHLYHLKSKVKNGKILILIIFQLMLNVLK